MSKLLSEILSKLLSKLLSKFLASCLAKSRKRMDCWVLVSELMPTYERRNGEGDPWKIGCLPNDLVGEDATISYSYKGTEI